MKNLRRMMSKIQPTTPSSHDSAKVFVYPNIKTASHVFIRNDAVRTPLQQPYEGPYKVLERKEKYFKLLIKNRKVNVSIDRLKSAFIPPALERDKPPRQGNSNDNQGSQSSHTTSSPYTTRSGRKVRLRYPL